MSTCALQSLETIRESPSTSANNQQKHCRILEDAGTLIFDQRPAALLDSKRIRKSCYKNTGGRARAELSPTIFRAGGFRFYFFSREETRPHVHVYSERGEAKFWLDPSVELAKNSGMTTRQIRAAKTLIEEHEDEIRSAWQTHFGR